MPADRDQSLFERTHSGPAGLDPYAAAVSDVYQDLFGEGSYTGKGIYDVDAFTAALAGRVPENALLSHDLIEGIFARAGLVADVELFEEFPIDYEVAAARQHRWARGDWQLLPFIFEGAADSKHPARIPLIGRWKMLDNLRRTLSAPAAWLTLVVGWTLPHTRAARVDRLRRSSPSRCPPCCPALADLIPDRRGISKRAHIRAVGQSFAIACAQIALGVTFLAHQAWLMSDAIVRTLGRLYLTHRRLLEWTTAAQAKSGHVPRDHRRVPAHAGRADPGRRGRGAGGARRGRTAPWSPRRSSCCGASRPLVARWVSRPPRLSPIPAAVAARTPGPSARPRAAHGGSSRPSSVPPTMTCRPDNFQEDPGPSSRIARRPTNIGLYLLSTVAARDFGWLGSLDMRRHGSRRRSRRWAASSASGATSTTGMTRATFARWSPATCPPWTAGISPAICSFSAMRARARSTVRCSIPTPSPASRTRSCSSREAASALARRPSAPRRSRSAISTRAARRWPPTLREPPTSPADWAARLRQLAGQADALVDIARTLTAERGDGEDADVLVWAQATRATIASHERDARTLMPWAPHLAAALSPISPPQPPEAIEADRALLSSSSQPGRAGRPLRGRGPRAHRHASRCAHAWTSGARGRHRARRRDHRGARGRRRRRPGRSSIASRPSTRRHEASSSMRWSSASSSMPRARSSRSATASRTGASIPSAYDLLASEARLPASSRSPRATSPTSHWFHLGRPMTPVALGAALVSWSGSMFEYLMPALVMQLRRRKPAPADVSPRRPAAR